jgi:hypothetical protein
MRVCTDLKLTRTRRSSIPYHKREKVRVDCRRHTPHLILLSFRWITGGIRSEFEVSRFRFDCLCKCRSLLICMLPWFRTQFAPRIRNRELTNMYKRIFYQILGGYQITICSVSTLKSVGRLPAGVQCAGNQTESVDSKLPWQGRESWRRDNLVIQLDCKL